MRPLSLSVVALFIVVASLLSVAACGKKAAPAPPGPPDQVTYPRTYPAY